MVREVKDYVEIVQKRYPFLTQSEINKIITFARVRFNKYMSKLNYLNQFFRVNLTRK